MIDDILTNDFLAEIKRKTAEAAAKIDWEALSEQAREKIEAETPEAEKRQAERNKVIKGIFDGIIKVM